MNYIAKTGNNMKFSHLSFNKSCEIE